MLSALISFQFVPLRPYVYHADVARIENPKILLEISLSSQNEVS